MSNETGDGAAWAQRYARQLALPEIGLAGQQRLGRARVLIVGAGGLGSPAAYYLAAAGVGTLRIADDDVVDLSNLQRQILHATADVGRPKAASAADSLLRLNPELRVEARRCRFDRHTAGDLAADADFVIDAADNFEAKFLIADVCHELGKPYSHAGIDGFAGQTMTVLPGRTACYRCVFQAPPGGGEARAVRGPLGAVPGVVGAVQATEAVKCLLGIGTLLTDRLLVYDALSLSFRSVALRRNEECPLCGTSPGAPGGTDREGAHAG